MSLFRRNKQIVKTPAHQLYEHLYRMGISGQIDEAGAAYVKAFNSFWYPMIKIAEKKGTLPIVISGLALLYDAEPNLVLSWDDPVNESLRYETYAKIISQLPPHKDL